MNTFTHDQECPGCGSICVKKTESSPYIIWHGRSKVPVPQYEFKCLDCKSTWSDDAMINANIATIREWAKNNKKLVLAQDVKKLRILLGVSQEKAADIFGGGKRAFYKWENNKNGLTETAEALFYLVLRHPELAEEIAEAKGISLTEESTDDIYELKRETAVAQEVEFEYQSAWAWASLLPKSSSQLKVTPTEKKEPTHGKTNYFNVEAWA